MANRVRHDHRWLLAAGVAMALAFWLLRGGTIATGVPIALKGGSVALLAAYALAASSHRDARILAAVLALGATGDVFIEFDTVAGAVWFLLGHLVAIGLYRRNRRENPSATQRGAAAALLIGVPLSAWLLTHDVLAVLYAAALAAMAACAWLSRFSRYSVGLGALLFVASDLLIFARLGGALPGSLTGWLIWPLYYAGQLLIATGVISALRSGQDR